MSNYSEKLKHPKWQKKRLEILQRDEFTCQECGDTESTLHVHHLCYNGDPWETDDKLLITLCFECHLNEESLLKESTIDVIKDLKRCGFMGKSFPDLKKIFSDTNRGWATYEPAFDIIKMVVDDDTLWKQMESLFWERLSEKQEDKLM